MKISKAVTHCYLNADELLPVFVNIVSEHNVPASQ